MTLNQKIKAIVGFANAEGFYGTGYIARYGGFNIRQDTHSSFVFHLSTITPDGGLAEATIHAKRGVMR